MSRLNIVQLFLLFLVLMACENPHFSENDTTNQGIELISASLVDGSGDFRPETPPPYHDQDTIKIVLPYYYPEGSSNKLDISNMRLTANLPNNVIIRPPLAVHDLSIPLDIRVTLPNGEVLHHTIIGEVKKTSKLE